MSRPDAESALPTSANPPDSGSRPGATPAIMWLSKMVPVNSADAQEQYTSLVFALQASKELMPPGARAGLTSTLEALMYIKQLDLAADGGSGAPPFWDPASRQAWRELIEHLRECNGCTPERAPSTPGAATPPPAPASPTQTSTPKL
jgi:hypothetical protein